ncbi:MAG: tetratricopeptide repeat protein [Alistipes sp.]|nr:tetratricopeptide repeat protein [Alistipes sp.]
MAKEVVKPQDEMLDNAQVQTENFFEKNSKMVVVAIVVIFVLAAAIFGYKKLIVEPRLNDAQEMLYEAQYRFEQQNADFALALNGDDNTPGFAQVVEKYGNTPAGNLATVYAAACAMRLGDFDTAESYLAKYSDVDGLPGELVNAMAVGLRGEIAVEKGDYAGAAAIFENAAKVSDNNFTAPMYLYKAAMAYEAAGNAEKYRECLQTITDKYSSSLEARDAEKLTE